MAVQQPVPVTTKRTPHRKVLAAGLGAGFGGATSDLAIGGLADLFNNGHPLPGYLSAWLALAIPAGLGLAAGYLTRRAADE